MRHAKPWCVTAALVAWVAASPAALRAERYSAVEIGPLALPAFGSPMNNAGDVGGFVEVAGPGGPVLRPFLFRGEIRDLGMPDGAVGGSVTGVNDRGQAAVGYDFPGGVSRPYLFNGGGPLEPIALPAGFTSASPGAINNLGHMAGTMAGPAAGGPAAAPFVYANGTMSVLPLPAGADRGFARGINDRGDVLVAYLVPSGDSFTERAAVWSAGNLTELTPPEGWTYVEPVAINEHGHVLGRVHLLRADGNTVSRRPVLYRDGVATVLEQFGTGDTVNGMNDDGAFVGHLLGLTTHGYLYADGTITDLTGLVSLADGFSIYSARDVNNMGQILVRARNAAGDTRTYVLTPVPEPGAAALALGIGAWALLARRRADTEPAGGGRGPRRR